MKNLRLIRKQHNISMKKLGEAINLGESTISQYESGNREPSFDILIKIADYFNVSIDYLLGRSDSAAPAVRDSQLIDRPEYTLSDKFARDYTDLLKDTNFIEMTKLFNGITAEYRALSLGYIVGLLQKHGINTKNILGY